MTGKDQVVSNKFITRKLLKSKALTAPVCLFFVKTNGSGLSLIILFASKTCITPLSQPPTITPFSCVESTDPHTTL